MVLETSGTFEREETKVHREKGKAFLFMVNKREALNYGEHGLGGLWDGPLYLW